MNFISRIIKSINAMRERLKIERHEAMYGPHFNEECALKAVSKMENEDGSRGEHWSLEETTSIANQYGINLKGEKYNEFKAKKKQQVSMMKKWRSVKIFQINQKHRQKILQ